MGFCIAGDVGALGWWDLFINYGYAYLLLSLLKNDFLFISFVSYKNIPISVEQNCRVFCFSCLYKVVQSYDPSGSA